MFMSNFYVSPQGHGPPTGELTRPGRAGKHPVLQNSAHGPETTKIPNPSKETHKPISECQTFI